MRVKRKFSSLFLCHNLYVDKIVRVPFMEQKGGYTKHMFNPYQPYLQSQQIIRVNGEGGAKAYQMQPNSSVLMLDESAPRLFLKITDGAGFPSITAYKLEPYVEEPVPTLDELTKRIENLERMVNNEKSNTPATKRKTDQPE